MNEFYFTKTKTKSIKDSYPWAVLNRNDQEFESMFFENRRVARFVVAKLNALTRGVVGGWMMSSGEIPVNYKRSGDDN